MNFNELSYYDDSLIYLQDYEEEIYYNNYRIQKTIDKISEIQLSDLSQLNNIIQCIICLDDFKIGQDVCILNCNHIFHHRCLYRNILEHQECPICRKKL